MKKIALFLGVLIALVSCKDTVVEKPAKLIDEQTMANIIYDLTVLEAIKTKDPKMVGTSTSDYVYKKYNIDSVQFASNNRYYSAEIAKYKNIYDKVNARLESEKKLADSLANKTTKKAPEKSGAPQIK